MMCQVSPASLHSSNQARTYLACMSYGMLSHAAFGQPECVTDAQHCCICRIPTSKQVVRLQVCGQRDTRNQAGKAAAARAAGLEVLFCHLG